MLKIDRSFAVGVPDDHAHSNLLAALIHMARALSVDVVVEGIESAQQVEFIRHQCADLIQGYYFAQPWRWLNYCNATEKPTQATLLI